MSRTQVSIVDYGMGNLYSVQKAIESCGATVSLARTSEDVERSTHLILPGVGSFPSGMQELRSRGLIAPIITYANSGKPLLGICLGMQMLATSSDEFGINSGLNLIPGQVQLINASNSKVGEHFKLPHIGWSALSSPADQNWGSTILAGVNEGSYVYMVHSYEVVPDESEYILAYCNYAGIKITAAIKRANIVGCQFHPEKSGAIGLRVLQNFIG